MHKRKNSLIFWYLIWTAFIIIFNSMTHIEMVHGDNRPAKSSSLCGSDSRRPICNCVWVMDIDEHLYAKRLKGNFKSAMPSK